jgi:hypothetical protein
MKHAAPTDLKEIYGHFQKRKDIFPDVRRDKLRGMIEKSLVIWQDGIVITYQQYRKRTRVGDVQVPAGAIMLHQILNSDQFSGAGGRVFEQFLPGIVVPSGGDLCPIRDRASLVLRLPAGQWKRNARLRLGSRPSRSAGARQNA